MLVRSLFGKISEVCFNFNRESDGRWKGKVEVWFRDDKNIHSCVRDCDRKIKKICYVLHIVHHPTGNVKHFCFLFPTQGRHVGKWHLQPSTGNDGGKTAALYVCVNVPSALMLAMEPVL
jgi:hypothetical protein